MDLATVLKTGLAGHFAHFVGIGTLEATAVHDGADGSQQAERLLGGGGDAVLLGGTLLAVFDFLQLLLEVGTLGDEVVLFLGFCVIELALLTLADARKFIQAVVDFRHSCNDV